MDAKTASRNKSLKKQKNEIGKKAWQPSPSQ